MSYTFEQKKGKVDVKITVSKADWEKYLEEAYEETKGKFNIQGFRKGKAPRKVIEKNYGPTVFYDEAMDRAFSKEYFDFLMTEKQVEPIANPDVKIEKFDDEGIVFTCTVETVPEVKLGDYKGLEVEKKKETVKAEDVENELKMLQERQARFVDCSDDETKMGDFVTIDFVGSIDGVEFDGGKAEDYRLELGSKSFIDTFEEQLVGLKVADKKDVVVTFPAEYHAEDLQNKQAVFAVTINKIERKEVPELNDDFASDVSEFNTLAEYKEDIQKRLQIKLDDRLEREVENELMEKIVKASEVEVPQVLVERQLDLFIRDFETRLSYQGIKLEDYVKYTNTTVEELRNSKDEQAKETVKTRLVLEEIIKQEKLNVTEEELDAKLQVYADRYKKSLEDYKKSIGNKELAYFENDLLMEKLIKFLKENNNIK